MIRIAICDDDFDYVERLKTLITDCYEKDSGREEVVIQEFSTSKFKKYLKRKGCHYDVLFLNAKAGEGDGTSFAKKVNHLSPKCILVYVSDSLEDVTKAYETRHVYFIWKKETKEALPKALAKVEEAMAEQDGDAFVTFKNKQTILHLEAKKIQYVEVKNRTIYIYTAGDVYSFNQTLKATIPLLPDYFVRTHNSFLVNMRKITILRSLHCVLSGGVKIPISRTYLRDVQKDYTSYLENLYE